MTLKYTNKGRCLPGTLFFQIIFLAAGVKLKKPSFVRTISRMAHSFELNICKGQAWFPRHYDSFSWYLFVLFQFSHIDPERWICIYPAYLNSRKSRAEGRLVPRDKGIADPNWMECQHVLAPKGFRFLVEPGKGYPKERSREPQFRGRVRLQLKGEDGQPLNPEFKTRYECQLIVCLLLRVKNGAKFSWVEYLGSK